MISAEITSTNNSSKTTELLTVAQASEMLSISIRTLWRMVSLGHLPAVRVGIRSTRFRRADVERYIRELPAR